VRPGFGPQRMADPGLPLLGAGGSGAGSQFESRFAFAFPNPRPGSPGGWLCAPQAGWTGPPSLSSLGHYRYAGFCLGWGPLATTGWSGRVGALLCCSWAQWARGEDPPPFFLLVPQFFFAVAQGAQKCVECGCTGRPLGFSKAGPVFPEPLLTLFTAIEVGGNPTPYSAGPDISRPPFGVGAWKLGFSGPIGVLGHAHGPRLMAELTPWSMKVRLEKAEIAWPRVYVESVAGRVGESLRPAQLNP